MYPEEIVIPMKKSLTSASFPNLLIQMQWMLL